VHYGESHGAGVRQKVFDNIPAMVNSVLKIMQISAAASNMYNDDEEFVPMRTSVSN
jgi:hypothetical protein